MNLARIVNLLDDRAALPVWLARAERLHRNFRPDIIGDYAAWMAKVFTDGGEMAVIAIGDRVVGLAVYRVLFSTLGRRLYVDDLVVDEADRSSGHGRRLLDWCEAEGRRRGADHLDLESGTLRDRAHRFYFREGMRMHGFGFRKALKA